MDKLYLVPDANGYSSTDGEDVISTELDGGVGRYRLDKIGSSTKVNVTWTLNQSQYQYFRAFFVTATKKGALAFLCDLVSEDGLGPVEQQCNFVPGSVGLQSQQGLTYVMQAQLEVKPLPHNTQTDLDVIRLFETAQGDFDSWSNALERVALVTIPENFYA